MSTDKTEVFTMYDTINQTWNVMDMNNNCLFFGSIDGLENWLDENSDRYQEQPEQIH